MSLPNRRHALPWVLGLALLAFTLVGANKLIQPHDPAAPPKGGSPAQPTGGTIVLGLVDSDPSPVPVGPPAVAPLATVAKVFVAAGDEVKLGQPLVQFDDALYRAKRDQAKAAVAAAEADVKRAAVAKELHGIDLTRQTNAVAGADRDVVEAEDALRIARSGFEKGLDAIFDPRTNQKLTDVQREERRRDSLELKQTENMARQVRVRAEDERLKLEQLRRKPVDLDADKAAAGVAQAKGLLAEAEAAVAALLVKAPLGGVVESVDAAPGVTFGPASRHPLLLLVPAGGRVVRAEVEAEFVTRIGPAGTKVTITDGSNLGVTYTGIVRRVGTTFVVKRSAADSLTLNPPKALECLIDIPDPAPAGKPPLRVGQPVRVVFP